MQSIDPLEVSMVCALSVRRLKPGSYDAFREAWEPKPMPESLSRAYHARSAADENVVVSFGLFEGTVDELRSAIGETDEAGRQERIAEHVESTDVDGLFEVLDEVTPGG
jgi:hypothetical protein